MLIPSNYKWVKFNETDRFGNLFATMNVDLTSNRSKLRLSPRTIITTDDITDLGVPVAFKVFTDTNGGVQYAWCIAGSYIFRMNLASGYQTAFAKDSATGSGSQYSSDTADMVNFGKTYLIATEQTDINLFTASSGQWTESSGDVLTSGTPHMLCVFGTRVYVTDEGTKVKSFLPSDINTIATSGSNFLNLANKGFNATTITFLRPTSTRIWVGTLNQSEEGCQIFAWDGSTATDPNEVYDIKDASGILAGVIRDDVPWVIDNLGRLLYFNGGAFIEAKNGRLPIARGKFLKNPLSSVNDRWIHPNGMDLVDGKINILINNEYEDNGATIEESIPSGIWEYDDETGWYHKMSLSLYTSSVSDFGQNRVSRVGAIYANRNAASASTTNGSILMGAQIYSDATTTKEIIAIDDRNDTVQKAGYFITTKIYSPRVEEYWQKLYIRFRQLLNSTDSITLRYRTTEESPTEATITWTSTTTFTTTTNISAYSGYEVEVLQGKGSGLTAKITNVSESGGTYTATVDTTFTGASSGTAKARFQKWITLGTYNKQTQSFIDFGLGFVSTWIQFKVCLVFTGKDEVDDMYLVNKPKELAQ